MMKKTPRYWCVVPAAGVGKRMGASIPKQYLPLNGRLVIEHTLEKLIQVQEFERIIVCLSEEDTWWERLEWRGVDNNVGNKALGVIDVVPGGQERCDSVLNGLQHLIGKADERDWVLVHDVARPCVRVEDIKRLIDVVSNHPVGGLLGMPVRDTMKRANADNAVNETVCRDNLWHALTPQMFRYGDLMRAISEALAANYSITDEASAIEFQGKKPLLIEGHPDNIKITQPNDLALAALFLDQQGK